MLHAVVVTPISGPTPLCEKFTAAGIIVTLSLDRTPFGDGATLKVGADATVAVVVVSKNLFWTVAGFDVLLPLSQVSCLGEIVAFANTGCDVGAE